MGAHSRAVRRLAFVTFSTLATPAFAETSTINAADTAWMITATALVQELEGLDVSQHGEALQ
jgi:Amt family ammonium transporter